ncbi:MAG: hypothetical protein H6513_18850 [Acidimicrobiaceae bacterium]|nr:hypothetical protein [Acidimicrobiaceae bacterium]
MKRILRRPLCPLAALVVLVLTAGCGSPAMSAETTQFVTSPVANDQTTGDPVPTDPTVTDGLPGQADYEGVIDRLVELDGKDLITVAHLAGGVLFDEGFPSDWWSRLDWIVVGALDRENYPPLTPVSISRGASVGSMEICIGDECHVMILFGEATKQIAVDGVVLEQFVVEAPDGFLVYGWCSPDTVYAYGYTPFQTPLPLPGLSDLRVSDPPTGQKVEFVVDIDRHVLADAQLPTGWSLTCA